MTETSESRIIALGKARGLDLEQITERCWRIKSPSIAEDGRSIVDCPFTQHERWMTVEEFGGWHVNAHAANHGATASWNQPINEALEDAADYYGMVTRATMANAVNAAVLAERERCAKIAEACFNRAPAEIVTLIRGGK